MMLKPLPMSLHNVTCEHVLGLIYSFISVIVKSIDPVSQLDNIMHLTKRILSISDMLMHKVLGDYLSQSSLCEQQK